MAFELRGCRVLSLPAALVALGNALACWAKADDIRAMSHQSSLPSCNCVARETELISFRKLLSVLQYKQSVICASQCVGACVSIFLFCWRTHALLCFSNTLASCQHLCLHKDVLSQYLYCADCWNFRLPVTKSRGWKARQQTRLTWGASRSNQTP